MVTIGLSRTVSEINGDVRRKSPIFPPPVYLTPPLKGSPWNFVSAQGSQKTRMTALSDGRKSFPIDLAVLIQYRSVTATQPPSHVAVAITINAKASSLKTMPRAHSFRHNTTTSRKDGRTDTDRQTDRNHTSISRVSVLSHVRWNEDYPLGFRIWNPAVG